MCKTSFTNSDRKTASKISFPKNKDMEDIIAPVSRELLKAELTPERRLRSTNKSNNEIYVVTYQQAPNVVREIGRLP